MDSVQIHALLSATEGQIKGTLQREIERFIKSLTARQNQIKYVYSVEQIKRAWEAWKEERKEILNLER